MPYEPSIDVVQILRSTAYLLEHSDYPQRDSATIAALVLHLHQAIAGFEAQAKVLPQGEDAETRRPAAKRGSA